MSDSLIVERLRRWAEWLQVRNGGAYPSTNILHPSWMPPSGQRGSAVRLSGASDGPATHRVLCEPGLLSEKQLKLVELIYLRRLTHFEAAFVMECAESTISKRLTVLHALIDGALSYGSREFC